MMLVNVIDAKRDRVYLDATYEEDSSLSLLHLSRQWELWHHVWVMFFSRHDAWTQSFWRNRWPYQQSEQYMDTLDRCHIQRDAFHKMPIFYKDCICQKSNLTKMIEPALTFQGYILPAYEAAVVPCVICSMWTIPFPISLGLDCQKWDAPSTLKASPLLLGDSTVVDVNTLASTVADRSEDAYLWPLPLPLRPFASGVAPLCVVWMWDRTKRWIKRKTN